MWGPGASVTHTYPYAEGEGVKVSCLGYRDSVGACLSSLGVHEADVRQERVSLHYIPGLAKVSDCGVSGGVH